MTQPAMICSGQQAGGDGVQRFAGPGVIALRPRTQLAPDVLVFPARFPVKLQWTDDSEHWLAVEVISRLSRMYDREFKRDAQLRVRIDCPRAQLSGAQFPG